MPVRKSVLNESINPTDIAWIAGFFDGEGSVGVRHTKKRGNRSGWFQLTVTIVNTHRPSLDRIVDVLGIGKVYSRKLIEGRRPVFAYQIADYCGELFLSTIQPYVFTKAVQVETALKFRELGQLRRFEKVPMSHYVLANEYAETIRQANGMNYRKDCTKPIPLDYVEAA